MGILLARTVLDRMKQMCPTRSRFEQQWQDSRVAEGIRVEIRNGVILQKGFVLQKLSTQL